MLTSLEQALFEAISLQKQTTAQALIELSSLERDLNLEKCDDKDKNFIVHAIEFNLPDIADKLFSRLEQAHNVIFQVDKNNRTLAWYAANYHDMNILEKFITLSFSIDKYRHKLFTTDINGNTPLHIAASKGDLLIIRMILNCIHTYPCAMEWINQANLDGNTALHLAAKKMHIDALVELQQAGTISDCCNNDNETILDCILHMSADEQVSIFNRFNNDIKKTYLEQIKNKLYAVKDISSPEGVQLLKSYMRWAALHSLESYLLARLEFDRVYSARATKVKNNLLHDSLLERMPLYQCSINSNNRDFQIQYSDIASDINNDRERLNTLITQMSDFLNQLQNRPKISKMSQFIAHAGPFIFSTILIGLVVYFSKLAHEHTLHATARTEAGDDAGAQREASKGVNDVLIAVITALFGCMVDFFISILWYGKFSTLQIRVMHREWAFAFSDMQEIAVKLTDHHDEDVNVFESTLMKTNPTYYNNFLVKVDHLADRRIVITQLIEYMTDLITILKTLRSDMNISNKPLGLFNKKKEYILLDIEEAKEADEDNGLLMNRFTQ